MKKLFSLLTLALLTMSAWAQTTVTFTAGTDVGLTEANNSADTISKDGVTIICTDAAFATAQYRFYANSTATITSTVGNITKVEFTCTATGTNNYGPGNSTYTTGTYTTAGSVGTWTGEAATVEFTTSKQMRATQIVITIGGEVVETVAAPTLPAAQNFDDSFVVEITNIAEGATAMYSTDNLTWQTYSAPFTITETTTVYAKAVKGEIESEVVHAKYTKNTPVTGTCITFNYADDEAITTAAEYTVERPGASFTVSNGLINGHYRIYKNQTITFNSTAGNIIRIEFDGVSGNPVSNFGEVEGMSYDGNNGTWVGSAETVTFTASLNQVRCTEIRVYVDGELPSDFVAAPTFNPAACEFEESIDVTINAEDGATIKYNTDGETWMDYSAPIHLTATTTIIAKAIKGNNESTVATATYTLKEVAGDITTLAQVNALTDGTEFEFMGDAVVTYQNGQYLFLRDETGYGLIYGTIDGTFENSQILNQGWTAKKTTYRTLTEYTNAANLSASGNTDAELAAPQVITALSEDMVNAYVIINNVDSIVGTTAYLADGTTIALYKRFDNAIPELKDGNITIKGIVSIYNNNLQLYFIEAEGYTPPEPEVYDVNNIAEALELADGSKFTMYNDVVVTYQNGNRLWIRDTENGSGLIYGAVDGTFENGQVLSDGWTATYTVYNNVPEFTNPEDVEAAGDETREADPFERTTITNDNVNEYVILKGLTLLTDETNAKRFYNAADSLVLFNTFNIELPTVEEGKTYDVTGLVTIYYGKPQIYITEMTEVAAAGKRGDVNLDNAVNIADVTALIDYLLSGDATGISLENANCNQDAAVNIADVTALIDYLLSGAW